MKFKRLSETAIIPTRGTEEAAGLDLYADIQKVVSIYPGKTKMIPTNIAMEIPDGYYGQLAIRSGISTKKDLGLINGIGVIDSDYRNAVGGPVHNYGKEVQSIQPGERIAQIIIQPYLKVSVEEVEELSSTERGLGGFGSTGSM